MSSTLTIALVLATAGIIMITPWPSKHLELRWALGMILATVFIPFFFFVLLLGG